MLTPLSWIGVGLLVLSRLVFCLAVADVVLEAYSRWRYGPWHEVYELRRKADKLEAEMTSAPARLLERIYRRGSALRIVAIIVGFFADGAFIASVWP